MLRNLSSDSFRGLSHNHPAKFINSAIHMDPKVMEQFQTQNSIVHYRTNTTSSPVVYKIILNSWTIPGLNIASLHTQQA